MNIYIIYEDEHTQIILEGKHTHRIHDHTQIILEGEHTEYMKIKHTHIIHEDKHTQNT